MEESDHRNRNHHHTPAEERRIRDAALDDTIAATFPASDPLSTNPNPDAHEEHGERPPPDSDRER